MIMIVSYYQYRTRFMEILLKPQITAPNLNSSKSKSLLQILSKKKNNFFFSFPPHEVLIYNTHNILLIGPEMILGGLELLRNWETCKEPEVIRKEPGKHQRLKLTMDGCREITPINTNPTISPPFRIRYNTSYLFLAKTHVDFLNMGGFFFKYK